MRNEVPEINAGTIYIGAVGGSLAVIWNAKGSALESDLLEEIYERMRDEFLENVQQFFPDRYEEVKAYVGYLERDRGNSSAEVKETAAEVKRNTGRYLKICEGAD